MRSPEMRKKRRLRSVWAPHNRSAGTSMGPKLSFSVRLFSVGRAIPAVLFFFNDTATTEIYTLSLHDALPHLLLRHRARAAAPKGGGIHLLRRRDAAQRSEEHTSELQSHLNLVCRLLLEKK